MHGDRKFNWPHGFVMALTLVAMVLAIGAAPVRADLVIDPTYVDFGDMHAGEQVFDVVDVRAVNAPATIAVVDLLGQNTPYVILDEDCSGATLQPDEICSVAVGFEAPSDYGGEHNGTLRVLSTGNLYAAFGNFTAWSFLGGRPDFAPAALDFGLVRSGQASRPKTAVLTNEGDDNMEVAAVGASDGFGVQSTTCAGLLEPGASCSISVVFRPAVAGEASGVVSVQWSDPWLPGERPPASIALRGVATGLFPRPFVVPRPPRPTYGTVEIDLANLTDSVPSLVRGGPARARLLPAFDAPTAGRLTVALFGWNRAGRTKIGAGKLDYGIARSGRLRLRLNRKGVALLRRPQRTRIKVVAKFKPRGDAVTFRQGPEFVVKASKAKRKRG
jgi:hypothetical protein